MHAAVAAAVAVLVTVVSPLWAGAQETPVEERTDDRPADVVDAVPGGGTSVRMARATWDTGWFQAQIMAQLLTELGFVVDGPRTMDNADFYDGVASGEVDLWVNGWFPLHTELLPPGGEAVPIGTEVDGGALQGYLADTATIERFGIESLEDLTDPDIAAAFDRDGDGRADLIGCETVWACAPIVDGHLTALGLTDTVEHVQGDYGPLMRDVAVRAEAGEPVLFYTFTPNWTTGELVPGVDVSWLPVPVGASGDPVAPVDGVRGCLQDPCPMGFAPNDIRAVASETLIDDQPAIEQLLSDFTVSPIDIAEQNARMVSNAADADDIEQHAAEWILANRTVVDDWLDAATTAHIDAGLPLSAPPGPSSSGGSAGAGDVGTLRVVSRLSPPFVQYDDRAYGGFSLELWDMVATRIGADYDVYAVNSAPKLIDEVLRGEADVGVAAVGVTPEREEQADFSHPYLDTGLQVMVPADPDEGFLGGTFGSIVARIFSWQLLSIVVVLFIALSVAAHIIWLTERGRNDDFPSDYRSGILEAFWWSAVTATTVGYGDKTPKGTPGRIVGIIWMFGGLFLLAYFTAGIATAFTIDEIQGSIRSADDLPGHTVAVPEASVAEAFLDRNGIATRSYPSADETYDALASGDVDAVVHDAAILQYHVNNEGAGEARVVGLPFHQQQYAFVVDFDDPLRERINVALLEVIESGEYGRLYQQWFGRSAVELE